MAVSKEKKKEAFKKITEALKDSATTAFVNFKGLSVSDTMKLRRTLRAAGVSYTVVKKTLLRKALGDAGFSGEAPETRGELALAYGKDAIAPAREIEAFAKKFPDNLSLMGGIFEKAYVGKERMRNIARIPTRDVLLAQFVNLINSPLQRIAVVLNEVAKTREAK